MTPNLGQRACQAPGDVVVLGNVMASGEGVTAYDQRRPPGRWRSRLGGRRGQLHAVGESAWRLACRARSRSTAAAAASSAAPAAITAICQPAMPPTMMVWLTVAGGVPVAGPPPSGAGNRFVLAKAAGASGTEPRSAAANAARVALMRRMRFMMVLPVLLVRSAITVRELPSSAPSDVLHPMFCVWPAAPCGLNVGLSR